MNVCWAGDPGHRPSFLEICEILTDMLLGDDKDDKEEEEVKV